MATKITDEIQDIIKKVKVSLGWPTRPVQLTDEQICVYLEMCIEDYSSFVQNWVSENQWMSVYGKSISATDWAFALSTRTMDMANDYSQWFSKEVGLQQRGDWELQKDFIEIELGKQNYVIPAGREMNKVLYVNPPTSRAALFANYGGLDVGFGGGVAQLGGNGMGPVGGFYAAPAADVAYLATDLAYKNRLLRSDLVYKVTGGPNGTRILHLLSTPGSKLSFGHLDSGAGSLTLVGCQVWYTYYNTNPNNLDDCRRQNPDILLTPDQIPLKNMDFAFLNDPTKVLIRKLLVAKCKELLGIVRGTYSGQISIARAETTLDYQMLLTQGKTEWDSTMEELKERLTRMNPLNMVKTQAEIVENTIKIQKGTPLGIWVI